VDFEVLYLRATLPEDKCFTFFVPLIEGFLSALDNTVITGLHPHTIVIDDINNALAMNNFHIRWHLCFHFIRKKDDAFFRFHVTPCCYQPKKNTVA
jgi:hypothetical protein